MISEIKNKLMVLRKAVFDQRCPLLAKLIILLAIAYLLSPVDLIPDFIPVLGWLDDVIIIPFLLKLAYGIIPQVLIQEYEQENVLEAEQPSKAFQITGLFIVITIWFAVAYLVYHFFFYQTA